MAAEYKYRKIENWVNPTDFDWVIQSPLNTSGQYVPYNKETLMTENCILSCVDSALSPKTTLKFQFFVNNITNINSIYKIGDNYPLIAGFILPLVLNNEYNSSHQYDSITSEELFNQFDFRASLSISKLERTSPDVVQKTIIGNINSFNFRESFGMNNLYTNFNIDFASGVDIIKETLSTKIQSIYYSGNSLPNSNKQLLYCDSIHFPNSETVNSNLRNKSISGLIILISPEDIENMIYTNEDYANLGLFQKYPVEYTLEIDLYGYLGLGKIYNQKVNSDLYNLDFRILGEPLDSKGNLFFTYDSFNGFSSNFLSNIPEFQITKIS